MAQAPRDAACRDGDTAAAPAPSLPLLGYALCSAALMALLGDVPCPPHRGAELPETALAANAILAKCGRPRLWFVLGPTAAGKSDFATALARCLEATPHPHTSVLRAHVVNCDASQLHSGLPIATNKPSATDLGAATHHLVGVLPNRTQDGTAAEDGTASPPPPGVPAPFTVGAFVRLAVPLIEGLLREDPGNVVIVCGGTAYYAMALLLEAYPSSGASQSSSADGVPSATAVAGSGHPCEDNVTQKESLWQQLHRIAPVTAKRFHPADVRRIATALEAVRSVHVRNAAEGEDGCPDDSPPALSNAWCLRRCWRDLAVPPVFVWVDAADRGVLDGRIDRRVTAMVRRGLVDEVVRHLCRLRRAPSAAVNGLIDEALFVSGAESAIGFKEMARKQELLAIIAEEEGAVATTAKEETNHGMRGADGCADDVHARVMSRISPLVAAASVEQIASPSAGDGSIGDGGPHQAAPRSNWLDAALDDIRTATRRYARQQQQFLSNRLAPLAAGLLPPGHTWRCDGSRATAACDFIARRMGYEGGAPPAVECVATLPNAGGCTPLEPLAAAQHSESTKQASSTSIVTRCNKDGVNVAQLRPRPTMRRCDECTWLSELTRGEPVEAASDWRGTAAAAPVERHVIIAEGEAWERHESSKRHRSAVRRVTQPSTLWPKRLRPLAEGAQDNTTESQDRTNGIGAGIGTTPP